MDGGIASFLLAELQARVSRGWRFLLFLHHNYQVSLMSMTVYLISCIQKRINVDVSFNLISSYPSKKKNGPTLNSSKHIGQLSNSSILAAILRLKFKVYVLCLSLHLRVLFPIFRDNLSCIRKQSYLEVIRIVS